MSTSKFLRVYNLCMTISWPLTGLYAALRSWTDGKYAGSFSSRLGLRLPEPRPPVPCVWFHALSVGETLSVVPLVKAFKIRCPHAEIVFSSATETGQAVARARLHPWVSLFFYLPHDFPWIMDLLVRRIEPGLFVLVETDIWPNLLEALKSRRIPAVLVNGRLSPKSFRRLASFGPVSRDLFSLFDGIFAQSRLDADRYRSLGVSSERVHVAGNLKFDASGGPLDKWETAALRKSTGITEGRPSWIAGSTHDGEEESLLRIHAELRREHPDLLLILAPRQIHRASAIRSLCHRHALPAAVRSSGERAGGRAVYLLDTLGELSRFYALADIAFIGGSLVPFGGHNPLEAVAQRKPALWGPHLFNFRDMEEELMDAGCGRKVLSEEELRTVLKAWFADAEGRMAAQQAADNFLASHSRCSRLIADFLKEKMPMP